MKLIVILLIFLTIMNVIVSCGPKYQPSRSAQLVNSTLGKAAKIIKEKFNILPCGTGAAMPGGPIQELTLCFSTKYPNTKQQLRILLIKAAQELLGLVNSNEEIQQFIKKPPFTINNIQIIIYNHDKQGNSLFDPDILTAEISQSTLTYRTVESNDNFIFKNEFKETYEEALKEICK